MQHSKGKYVTASATNDGEYFGNTGMLEFAKWRRERRGSVDKRVMDTQS